MIEDLPDFETPTIAPLQNNVLMIHPATYFKQFQSFNYNPDLNAKQSGYNFLA